MAGEDALIGRGVLVADDLDGIEQVAKAGSGQLALLVEQVALGDQDQPIGAGKLLQRLAHMRQRLDRMHQHVTTCGQDLADRRRRDAAAGQLDRGLDHGKREALDAETVKLEVAPLRFVQPPRNLLPVAMLRQQVDEALFGQPIELLVLPKRVVGVEADGGEGGSRRGHSNSRIGRQTKMADPPGIVTGALAARSSFGPEAQASWIAESFHSPPA